MDMFEVKVYCPNGKLLRKSLIQAVNRDQAMQEALNVFQYTDGAHSFELE